MVHPVTARLTDPKLPAVAVLLSEAVPGPIGAVVEAAGGRVQSGQPIQVTWWPGTSITVRYRTVIGGGEMAGEQDFVAVSGRIPSGAAVVTSDAGEVGVWRVPHDPALPGLPSALDPNTARQVLVDLGGPDAAVRTRLRAYRPGRRAVVSVDGAGGSIYLKLLRPRKIEALHANHKALAESLPVPHSLGYSRPLGVMALQAMSGVTLRDALEDPAAHLPGPAEIAGLLASMPVPLNGRAAPSMIERGSDLAPAVRHLVGSHTDLVDRFVDDLGSDADDDLVPVHGDFYEAQLMIDGDGSLVGLLDVDTYGMGRRGDDPGVMIGHLALWETMSSQPDRVRRFARELLTAFDSLADPRDLRRRAAATLFTMVPGPFRVQTPTWPEETLSRLALARAWLDSSVT